MKKNKALPKKDRGVDIVIRAHLDLGWGSDAEFAAMTDAEIIELCHEDIGAMLDDATWRISRSRVASGRSREGT